MKTPKSRELVNRDYDLIDSGGFSARINGATIDVKKYAQFLNEYQIKLAFNLDTNDVEETLANQRYLDKDCPQTYIIPVYHVSDYVSKGHRGLLEYYIDRGYAYIGVGGVAGAKNNKEQERRFYNYIFNRTGGGIRCHGLGITSEKILQAYPWYSCDSSSFLAPAKFASMKTKGDKMAKVLARTRHYVERVEADLPYWKKLEDQNTRLWARRGIKWGDADYQRMIEQRNAVQADELSYEEWSNAQL